MPITTMTYGSTFINPAIIIATGTTTILAAKPNVVFELDQMRVNIPTLDTGNTVTIGFGTNANSPEIFYSENSNSVPQDVMIAQPGRQASAANSPLNCVIAGSGGSINVRITCGYHEVPSAILPASQTGPG